MRNHFFHAAAALLLTLAPAALHAADAPEFGTRFSGRVTCIGTGEALAGTEVSLTDDAGKQHARTTTDKEGRFTLNADPGRYTLNVAGRARTAIRVAAQGDIKHVDVLLPEDRSLEGASDDDDDPLFWWRVGVPTAIVAVPLVIVILGEGPLEDDPVVSP